MSECPSLARTSSVFDRTKQPGPSDTEEEVNATRLAMIWARISIVVPITPAVGALDFNVMSSR